MRENFPNRGKRGFQSTQYCPKGHDKNTVGRNTHGSCVICTAHKNRLTARRCFWKRTGIKNPDGSVFTLIDYDRLYQIQQGHCKICHTHQSELTKSLSIDHNHKTGIIRGLLCGPCNFKVSTFEDALANQIRSYLGEL